MQIRLPFRELVKSSIISMTLAFAISTPAMSAPAGQANAVSVKSSVAAARLFHLNDQIVFPGDKPFSLLAQSKINIDAYLQSLQPLTADEQQLIEKVIKLPLTISTRRSELIAKQIELNGILPMELLQAKGVNARSGFWNKTEQDLYGSSGWSFATVSAVGWTGLSDYGGVVYKINEQYWKSNLWANPGSGLKAYETCMNIRRSAKSMSGIPAKDLAKARNCYQTQITAPEHLILWIAYDVISAVREYPVEHQSEYFAADTEHLVGLMNDDRLGYLEGKLPGIPASALQRQ